MSDDEIDAGGLAAQLAEIGRLQRELTQQLHDRQDQEQGGPVAPWLSRRGAAQRGAPRDGPPWLARRGRTR